MSVLAEREATSRAGGATRRRRATWRAKLRRDWPLIVLTAPAVLLLLVFHYVPLLGNVIAFQDYSPFVGIADSPFVGLDNFQRLFGDPVFWHVATFDVMTNPRTFIFLVTSQAVWKDAGWGTIIFLAALSTVDANQYEAAAVDGASRWRMLWHVTLPALRPVIVLLLILRLGNALTVGFERFLMQHDAVGASAADVVDTSTRRSPATRGSSAGSTSPRTAWVPSTETSVRAGRTTTEHVRFFR